MIRVKISNFIKRNKNKISDLGKKLIIVAIVVFIATIILSFTKNTSKDEDNNTVKEAYTPRETVIEGKDISEEQYESDTNVLNQFLEYCNNKQIEEAYNLISEDCKENIYKTIDVFKQSYYNPIFAEKRAYNLQSWVSTDSYTVYRIRYTTDMLSTGKYQENNVYQDYITLIKNAESPKVSIGNFVLAEECDKKTEVNEISARIIKKVIYTEDEEYEIEVRNKTNKTIMLDSLNSTDNIKLIADSNLTYPTYISKIYKQDVILKPKDIKRIKLRFKKSCSSNKKTEYIQFYKVIRDYETYTQDTQNYTDTFSFRIKI